MAIKDKKMKQWKKIDKNKLMFCKVKSTFLDNKYTNDKLGYY